MPRIASRSSAVLSRCSCLGCGYDLSGAAGSLCPECGRRFDPSDPSTFDRGGRGALRSAATLAPPWMLNGLYALMVVPFFLVLCSPDGETADELWVLRMLVQMVTMVGWGAAFLLHATIRGIMLVRGLRQPRWRWGWVVIPVVLLGCVSLQQSGWLWWWRWGHARSLFAARLPPSGPPGRGGWIGTFHITGVTRHADGSVVFSLGFPDLYSQGPPEVIFTPMRRPSTGGPSLTDLGGGWWLGFNPT